MVRNVRDETARREVACRPFRGSEGLALRTPKVLGPAEALQSVLPGPDVHNGMKTQPPDRTLQAELVEIKVELAALRRALAVDGPGHPDVATDLRFTNASLGLGSWVGSSAAGVSPAWFDRRSWCGYGRAQRMPAGRRGLGGAPAWPFRGGGLSLPQRIRSMLA